MWKFDFPFLADKLVWEQTVNAFVEEHPELKVTYIYTGPSELNSKKKTHLLRTSSLNPVDVFASSLCVPFSRNVSLADIEKDPEMKSLESKSRIGYR